MTNANQPNTKPSNHTTITTSPVLRNHIQIKTAPSSLQNHTNTTPTSSLSNQTHPQKIANTPPYHSTHLSPPYQYHADKDFVFVDLGGSDHINNTTFSEKEQTSTSITSQYQDEENQREKNDFIPTIATDGGDGTNDHGDGDGDGNDESCFPHVTKLWIGVIIIGIIVLYNILVLHCDTTHCGYYCSNCKYLALATLGFMVYPMPILCWIIITN